MALENLTETLVLITQGQNNGVNFQWYDRRDRDWDTDLKDIVESGPFRVTWSEDEGTEPPRSTSRPITDLLDAYTVPSSPAAPGYDVTAVGRRRRIFHDGNGGVRRVDTDACNLAISGLIIYQPTSPGGFGYIQVDVSTVAATISMDVELVQPGITTYFQGPLDAVSGRQYIYNLPASTTPYTLRIFDSNGCRLRQPFPMAGYSKVGCMNPDASNYDPQATEDQTPSLCQFEPPSWSAVGGLMPPPVWVPTPVELLTPLNTPRIGLYVEVEFYRFPETGLSGLAAPFARGRKQVRLANERFNAAPLLAGELAPLQRYGARVPVQIDTDASLAYTYRFRAVDNTGPGAWQYRPRARYAVLAAPEEDVSDLLPYVTLRGSGPLPGSLSAFAEQVHFVGLPLEYTLLVPPRATGVTLYAELLYLDSRGNELEIRSIPIFDDVPPGVLRVALPDTPLPCANVVQVALVDTNRAYNGTCVGVGAPTPNEGLLIINDGFLKL